MTALAERLARLTPEQRELLHRKLRERGGPAAAAEPAIPLLEPDPAARFEPFPLSEVQRAYWIGRQGVYGLSGAGTNAYFELHFEDAAALGEGWPGRLEAAFRRLVERHDMLRAEFQPDGRQRVLAEVPPLAVEVVDLSGAGAAAVEERLAAVRERMRYGRGDLERWPLSEALIHLLPDGGLRLHVRFESLIVDGDSRNLLFRELFRFAADPGAELPPPACTYRDYVLTWERFRRGDAYRRAREWWLARIPGMPPPPALPWARPPLPETPGRLAFRSLRLLDKPRWEALRRRSGARGLTPATLVISAFADLLAAWCREPGLTLAVEGSYRPPVHPGIAGVVGNFNTVLLLACEGGAGTFAERAARLGEQSRAALDRWTFSGFEVLREMGRLRPSPWPPMPVLFNSLIEYSHPSYLAAAEEPAAEEPGPEPLFVDAGGYLPQLGMLVTVAEYEDLYCRWQAAEGMFPDGLQEAMADGYGRLLGALADGDAPWDWPWPRLAGLCGGGGAGGVERDAPAVPAAAPPAAQPREPREPRDGLERQLAAEWADLLGVPRVGARDDFFALGGDSWRVALLAARLRRRFGAELPVWAFFERPTVEALAAALAAPAGAGAAARSDDVSPAGPPARPESLGSQGGRDV